MQLTRTCFGCKEKFRIEELVEYTGITATIPHWYCSKCLKEKQDREHFSDKVCQIFGIKSPGPRIWTERKRLRNTYGYTDDVIIDCLDYIYNVKCYKKLSESLSLITPKMVYAMKAYKSGQAIQTGALIAAMNTPIEKVEVIIEENTTSNKANRNFDDYLMD